MCIYYYYCSLECGSLPGIPCKPAVGKYLHTTSSTGLGGHSGVYGGQQGDYGRQNGEYGGQQEEYGGQQGKNGGLQGEYGVLQGEYGGLYGDPIGVNSGLEVGITMGLQSHSF